MQIEETVQIFEIQGSGFIPGVPGLWGNMRVKVKGDQVIEAVPLGQLFSDEKPPEPATEEQA